MVTFDIGTEFAEAKLNEAATQMINSRIFLALRHVERDTVNADTLTHAMACTTAYAHHMVKNLGFSSKDVNYFDT